MYKLKKRGYFMCNICGNNPCLTRCPNFHQKCNYLCCYCGGGILGGQDYLRNSEGQYIHRDCIPCTDYLIDWLGYCVETMDEEDYRGENY